MCIRDRLQLVIEQVDDGFRVGIGGEDVAQALEAVSYTHLQVEVTRLSHPIDRETLHFVCMRLQPYRQRKRLCGYARHKAGHSGIGHCEASRRGTLQGRNGISAPLHDPRIMIGGRLARTRRDPWLSSQLTSVLQGCRDAR